MRRALVVIEDVPLRRSLQLALHGAGFHTVGVGTAQEAARELAGGTYELVITRASGGALALGARREPPRAAAEPPASTDLGLGGQHPRPPSVGAGVAEGAP